MNSNLTASKCVFQHLLEIIFLVDVFYYSNSSIRFNLTLYQCCIKHAKYSKSFFLVFMNLKNSYSISIPNYVFHETMKCYFFTLAKTFKIIRVNLSASHYLKIVICIDYNLKNIN